MPDIIGEGSISGAEFDDGEGGAVVFPLVLNPLSDTPREEFCQLRGGSEIATRSEDGAGAGVVAVGSVESLGHEVVEAGERSEARLLG